MLGARSPIPLQPQRRKNLAVTSRALIFASVALVSGCAYDAEFADCTVRCIDDSACPDNLTCGAEGLCQASLTPEACAASSGTPLSCAGLAPLCGPGENEDCCSAAEPIPGGTFFRSYDVAGDGMYPSTSYPATVSPFLLDRFEVTVGRFRKFVEAGRGTRAQPPLAGAGARRLNGLDSQGGWEASWNIFLAPDSSNLVTTLKCDATYQTWTDAPGENEELPINCVTWYEAFAFCAWDGGFLPTEAEWNFAAAGGDQQRAYPWSNPPGSTVIDCSYANHKDGAAYCVPSAGGANRVGSESPKGEGRWGQTDLGGNIWEWTLDYYRPYRASCSDCTELDGAPGRVIRGGHFGDTISFLRSANRNYYTGSRFYSVGMRCGRQATRRYGQEIF